MVRRSTVASLDELRRAADLVAVVTVVDRSVEAVDGATDIRPQRYVAHVVVEESVDGSLEDGAELPLYISYSEGPRHTGLTSPGFDAALQPGAVALVGLVPDEAGEYGVVGGGAFVRSGEDVRYQGPDCEPTSPDVAMREDIEGLTWNEVIEAIGG